jgi:hypothetical protein
LVVSLGVALATVGVATSYAFSLVGVALLLLGLGAWVRQLLPGRGHVHIKAVEAAARARPIAGTRGTVEHIRQGMPGYRLRLPERVHPISAGIKGGIVGGLVMPLPALEYAIRSGHGIWWPVNLLAGMVVPGVGELSVPELERFHADLFAIAAAIHVSVSLILGLIYGVLMPTLPEVRRPIAWAALLMPIFWTAVSFVALGYFNPTVRDHIDWPWFVASQFIFGVVAALVYMRLEKRGPILAGLVGGAAGGLLMPLPALAWALLREHSIWLPINLLAAMDMRHPAEISMAELEQFNSTWLVAGIVTHAVVSLSFGLAFGVLLPRLPRLPAPTVWGGVVMPLLWTASSYGLMGVVNPVLQRHVDWPWFILSQFVFGIVAAIVVVRSEQVEIPPAGRGADPSLAA